MKRPSLTKNEILEVLHRKIPEWRADIDLFAREVFRFKANDQQKQFYTALSALVNAKFKQDMGGKLSPEEMELVRKRGISIRSGKGTGKDASAAIAVWWYLACFPGSKTYLLAPSMDNLRSNLIAEMSHWKSRRVDGEKACLLADELELLSTGARIKSDPDAGKEWFVRCNSVGPNAPVSEQLEVLQGKHGRFTLFVVDEASGVPDPVFQPLDTTLTDPVNFIVLLWNPNRRSGFAYDTHFGQESKYWINIHWNAEDSDLITETQIQYMKEKYGENSQEYRVSVKGEPPAADSDSLIPYEWCHAATELEFDLQKNEPIVFGVDVARQGNDSSIILVRQGGTVHEITELKKYDTIELARWIGARAAEWEPQAIYLDAIGLGIGVYDECRRLGIPGVYPVNVGNSARNEKFNRLRDELWWEARVRFENNRLSLAKCKDPELVAELSGVKYAIKEDNGKIKVESKAEMRKRGMPSPNKADALILTFMAPDATMILARKEKLREKEERVRTIRTDKNSWMGV